MNTAYTQKHAGHNEQTPRWELSALFRLLVAVQARDERIRRLEQFNRRLSVELDRITGTRARRRAA